MSNRPFLIFGGFVAVVAVIAYLAFSKEGSEEAAAVPVDAADKQAQEMFATNCGACHTLAAGGTDGVVGPNLDEILPTAAPGGTADPEANLSSYEGVYGRVVTAIVCGLGGRMPAGILQNEDAEEVAAFVAAYAGQLGDDQGPLVPADDRPTPGPDSCSPDEAGAPSEQ
jgi:mono/diheme cytochrome c family protein